MKFPCTYPQGWPRRIDHVEDGRPVAVIRHHDRCLLASIRVAGVHLPATEFEARILEATGVKQAAVGRGGGRGGANRCS